jgi:hypothetical protein
MYLYPRYKAKNLSKMCNDKQGISGIIDIIVAIVKIREEWSFDV